MDKMWVGLGLLMLMVVFDFGEATETLKEKMKNDPDISEVNTENCGQGYPCCCYCMFLF